MIDASCLPRSPAPLMDDPLAGSPYRFSRYINEGAMGQIAEAEHVALRRKVAVKLIRREYAALPGFVDRLRLEAQALAALAPRTPHVVAVLDFGRARDGRAYIVLELLQGRTLKEEIDERGPLPPSEVVTLAKQLLHGLACAHEAGIVHRDIKPSNIFLCGPEGGDRVLKILDFGIAKVLPGAAGDEALSPLSLPTAEGMVLGTPRFLCPEQACGEPVDHRSDLYSVGAVLYYLLTGCDPFYQHRGIAAVLRAQRDDVPRPPSAITSQSIPPALDQIVVKALSKRPEARFSSAADFSAALEQAISLAPAPQLDQVHQVHQSWAETERMDVSAFRGMGPSRRRTVTAARTEPLDVSAFRGVLRHRAPIVAPSCAPPTPNGPALEAPLVQSSPLDLRCLHDPTSGPHWVTILVMTVVVAVAFVGLLGVMTLNR